jgi:hypothetical protein
MAHHIDKTVKRYWCDTGTNSSINLDIVSAKMISDKGMHHTPRKTAESTGRLPPTPTEKTAVKAVNVIKFGAPPAAIPNTPVMKSVRLNEILSRK